MSMKEMAKKIDQEIGFTDALEKGEDIREHTLDYQDLTDMLSVLKEDRTYKDIDWYKDQEEEFLIIEIKNPTIKGNDKGIKELILTTDGRFEIKPEGDEIIMEFAFEL